MKRYALVDRIGTGASGDPFRPAVTGNWVTVGDRGGKVLVKRALPDSTATDNATIADLATDAQDVDETALSEAQRTAIKTRLTAAGVAGAQFDADGVADRRALLRFLLLRWLSWPAKDLERAITGYDVEDA